MAFATHINKRKPTLNAQINSQTEFRFNVNIVGFEEEKVNDSDCIQIIYNFDTNHLIKTFSFLIPLYDAYFILKEK